MLLPGRPPLLPSQEYVVGILPENYIMLPFQVSGQTLQPSLLKHTAEYDSLMFLPAFQRPSPGVAPVALPWALCWRPPPTPLPPFGSLTVPFHVHCGSEATLRKSPTKPDFFLKIVFI